MTLFESAIKHIPSSEKKVFDTLSDLRNLEKSKHLIPSSASIRELELQENRCTFAVDPIGKIELQIVDNHPSNMIKLEAQKAPVYFNLWIYLDQNGENQTNMQVKVQAEIPAMIKILLGGKMQQFVDQFADALAQVKYA